VKHFLTAGDPHTREVFSLVKCQNCGLIYTNPRPSPDERRLYYPDVLYSADSALVEKLTILQKYIEQGIVLDVGCGRGFFLNSIKQSFGVAGIEIDIKSSEFASKNFGIDIIANQITEINSTDKSFDLITFWHTLEHLPDPQKALGKASKILKDKGILIVAVPNIESMQAKIFGRNWYHLEVPRHLYHFSRKTLSRMIKSAGFSIQDTTLTLFSHNFAGYWRSLFHTLHMKYEFFEKRKIQKAADPRWYLSKFLRYIFYIPAYILANFERKKGEPGTKVYVAYK
jgi:2-polyprenyl-3-methyl-5-hydroxy-6-metoxy-1,4-benzoquinol methylase